MFATCDSQEEAVRLMQSTTLSASARTALVRLGVEDWDEAATVLMDAFLFGDCREHVSLREIRLAALRFESSIRFFNGM